MSEKEITQLNLRLSSPYTNTPLPDGAQNEATQELARLIMHFWKKQKQIDHDNEVIDHE
jgi:hypothetical protein